MRPLSTLAAALGLALAVGQSMAATPGATKTPTVKAAPPPVAVADEPISPAQLDIAPRVLTGRADCEFGQQVDIAAVEGRPGLFRVSHGKSQYMMVPQETSTGAVRLEDRQAGVMWLQIPAKSMLMNARAGKRVVDACQTAEQRATPAGVGIGIVAAGTR